jgi:hypothetical protein
MSVMRLEAVVQNLWIDEVRKSLPNPLPFVMIGRYRAVNVQC